MTCKNIPFQILSNYMDHKKFEKNKKRCSAQTLLRDKNKNCSLVQVFFFQSNTILKLFSKNKTFLKICKRNTGRGYNWWSDGRTFFFIHFFLFQPNSRAKLGLRSRFAQNKTKIQKTCENT